MTCRGESTRMAPEEPAHQGWSLQLLKVEVAQVASGQQAVARARRRLGGSTKEGY